MDYSAFDEKIKYQLSNLTSSNRLPHAIIIAGGNENIRDSVTDYLCKYAVCSQSKKPCYSCKNCLKATSHNHPDIFYVKGNTKTKNLIYNKEVMEEVIGDSVIIPNESDTKVYVFKDVDEKLPVISQNAFLKTLEEPPQNILFIMTCKDASVLLETILSRSTVINIPKEDDFDSDGIAIAEEIALSLLEINEYKLLRATYKLNSKGNFQVAVPYLKLLIRDALSLAVGGDTLSNSTVPQKLIRKLTREKSLSLLNTIEKAQQFINSNVNLNLLATWLCTEFRRIIWQQ